MECYGSFERWILLTIISRAEKYICQRASSPLPTFSPPKQLDCDGNDISNENTLSAIAVVRDKRNSPISYGTIFVKLIQNYIIVTTVRMQIIIFKYIKYERVISFYIL